MNRKIEVAAAIETSKHVHVAVLAALWRSNDKDRMAELLHGFCVISSMDADEPHAYAEMMFLCDLASGCRIDLEAAR